mmetsp:Transcript_30479/g.62821  ORF Transcript_30479/g.62821 Transcript_30479/m.62821 type:complete len:486 (-) Transcript_30479:330-1787(-)
MGFIPPPGPVREPVFDNPSPWQKKLLVAVVLACVFGISVAMTVCPPPIASLVLGETLGPDYGDYSVLFTDDGAGTALDDGDQTFVLMCSALVLIMTPGIAFFYGGMINHKNMIGTIATTMAPLAIIPFVWAIFGFTLAFGEDAGFPGIIGKPMSYGLMYNVGAVPYGGLSISTSTFFIFQGMFAIITPAIIVGAIADRVNFPSLFIFVPMWHLIVYCPIAHMVWGGGLISSYDILDFAGGMVVHMSSGYGALAAAYFLGPAKLHEAEGPANIPYVVLGTAFLWFGWYGFNGGSALGANSFAAHAYLNTTLATAAAMIAWMLCDQIAGKPFKTTGLCLGIVVGLVVITPACGLVNPGAAGIMGVIGSCVSYGVQMLMNKYGKTKADDTLSVFAAHGMGGTMGMLMTSLFQSVDAGAAVDGGFYGNGAEFGKCIIVLLCLVAWYLLATYCLMWFTNLFISMRVTEEEEEEGLDFSKHFEGAYKGDDE